MAINYGKDIGYARERLCGSIVALGEDLIKVDGIEGDGEVLGWSIGFNKPVDGISLDDIDTEPVRMGYVNYPSRCGYLHRLPERHYKQGFRNNNTIMRIGSKPVSWGYTQELVMMFRGVYPSVDACVESLFNGEAVSKAFSRSFAARLDGRRKNLVLDYKGKEAGEINVKSQDINLANKYMFLSEVLQKCV